MKMLALAAVLFFAFAQAATAHTFHFHPKLADRSLAGRAAGQRLIIFHDRAMMRLLRPYIAAGHPAAAPISTAFRFHAAQLRWTLRELRQTEAAIRAKARRTVSSHLSGWLCIHSREGAWNSQTGNGYYGGLQMSYGWMGVVGNAALLPPGRQIAVADMVARAHAYAYSWMQGQWPNTFPPCAHHF